MKEKKKDLIQKIILVTWLIWFLGALILFPILSAKNGYYGMMAFGQIFLSIGILVLICKNFVGIIFTFVGIACTLLPYLMMKPDINGYIINWELVITVLFVGAFVLSGLFLIFIPIIEHRRVKKRFTAEVEATIVDYQTTTYIAHLGVDGEKEVDLPIYEFYFEGQKYSVKSSAYSYRYLKELGAKVKLRINPENPEEFIEKPILKIECIVMGIGFLIIALPILMLLIEKGDFVK